MNEIYKRNIEAIKKNNPDLVNKIDKAEIEDWIQFTENNKNFTYKKAAKVYEAYPKEYKKEITTIGKQKIYHKDTATVIIGIGCGHLLKKITQNMNKEHRIIIIEPIMCLIKNTLCLYDFSKRLEKTQLVFVSTEKEISLMTSIFNELLCVQDWLVIGESYVLHCEEYSNLISYINQIINQIRCNVGTISGAGTIIAENDIKNIPYIIKHRGVKDLENLYKGKPAILVATGSAIENNIHMLSEIQDNAVIISIAQGLRMLLAYNVRPDFITTVDYGEINYEHFKGLMDRDVPLVALNRTYAPILKHWRGTKFIVGTYTPGFEETSTGIIQKKGYLESGGSVVHLSFQLAKLLGCNPIILVGHGYSFNRGLSHTKQVDAGGKIEIKDNMIKWKVHDPRSSIKNIEQNQGDIVTLPGIFGEPSIVNIGLASFVTTFETMFKEFKGFVINASEEGTDIKGTINMTFKKAIDMHLQKTIDKSVIKPLLSFDPESEKEIENIIPILKKDIENLNTLIEKTEFGIGYANDMLEYKDKPELFKMATKLNTISSNEAQECAKKNALISVAIYGSSRRITARDLKVKGKGKALLENLDIRVKRNKIILNAAKDAAEKLLPSYMNTLFILQQYQETKDISLLQSKIKEKIKLRDANKYFKVGNWVHPFIDAKKKIFQNKENIWTEFKREFSLFEYSIYQKALIKKGWDIVQAKEAAKKDNKQDRLDYYQLIQEAHKLGKDEKKFKEALRILYKAKKIFPEEIKARWGIATTLSLLKRPEESAKEYKKLIKDFPDNYRMQFEYAIVLLSLDAVDKAIEILSKVMRDTNEFNHFYKNLGKLYSMTGDNKKAKECYQKYLKAYPADTEIKDILKKS